MLEGAEIRLGEGGHASLFTALGQDAARRGGHGDGMTALMKCAREKEDCRRLAVSLIVKIGEDDVHGAASSKAGVVAQVDRL